jgi:hypothetical protein
MSSVSSLSFSVVIRSEAVRHMTDSAVSLTILAINECALRYGFNAEEALQGLNLSSVVTVESSEKKSRKARGSSRVDVEKPRVVKASFPLPYNGELNPMCCFGLRLCEGLYTQCRVARKGDAVSSFCKVCEEVALLNDGIPAYGTIQERKACYDSNVEFKDPKGKSPVAYSRVMRKHKLTESQVVEEAGKLNMIINPVHFTAVEGETKRGRPKAANKAPKEPKGAKGRPKKSKKVLEIDGGEDDLFATLMAEASVESVSAADDEVSSIASEVEAEVEIAIKPKESKKKAKDAAKEAEKEAEKALKAQEKEAEKLKKEQEKEAEKKLKETEKALKAAEKATKAAEKATKEAEKATKAQEKETEKALKAAEKTLKETEKKQKETAKSAPAVVDNEPDVVKRFEFEGKKYLKSKKTGIIYNMEQDVIGKWNDVTNKIDFTSTDEEVEEAYEEEEDEDEVDEE